MHNRPARGKRIGGGARGRGHDQAIGAVTANKIGVDGEFEIDHACQLAFVDHRLIGHDLAFDDVSARCSSTASITRSLEEKRPARISSSAGYISSSLKLV